MQILCRPSSKSLQTNDQDNENTEYSFLTSSD